MLCSPIICYDYLCSLFCLQEGLKERELCVFFRNNHFSTMFKVSMIWKFNYSRRVNYSDNLIEMHLSFSYYFLPKKKCKLLPLWSLYFYAKYLPSCFNMQINGELYLLATDQGYLNQHDLVWEKLNEVKIVKSVISLSLCQGYC